MIDNQPNIDTNDDIAGLSYEQALSELEVITSKLETDQNTLDEALALFERGQLLINHCSQLLDRVELRVQQLIGDELGEFPNQI